MSPLRDVFNRFKCAPNYSGFDEDLKYKNNSAFMKSRKSSLNLLDENENNTDDRRFSWDNSKQNLNERSTKDGNLSKTSEKIVLAAQSSFDKRDEIWTRRAIFGVTVAGDTTFRYNSYKI